MDDYEQLIQERNARVNIKYAPCIDRVELEIVSYCNVNCFACNRLCDSAPTNDQMSLSQIEKFVKESIDLNKKWKSIAIMGGEPSLHPDIKNIIEIIKNYHNFSPETKIMFISNGIGKKVKEVLSSLPSFFKKTKTDYIKNTRNKNNIIPEFGNSLLAPIDRLDSISKDGIINSCHIANTCGLGLNKYGYASCGCGASIARVLGIDLYAKFLKDATVEKSIEQLKILCLFCGRNIEYSIKCKHNSSISEFWRVALKNYRLKKINMVEY